MKSYKEMLDGHWKNAIAPRDKGAPTVVSLFAGCGGSSTGYRMAGFDVRLAVEWDANAVACYKANWPKTQVYHGDVGKLSVEEAMKIAGVKVGELDVLDGSPPCQGFSTAGKRMVDDPRNQLFKEYCRLLSGLKPKSFVMENVSGMIKGKMKLTFAEILRELRSCGYEVTCRLLSADWYGVPQSRKRVIFIGARSNLKIKPTHPNPLAGVVSVGSALVGVKPGESREISDKVKPMWRLVRPGQSLSKVHAKGHYFGWIKLNPAKPSPTILKTTGSPLIRWDEPRLLSIEELKRIGSFPDQYRLEGSFEEKWARIGNSVPPLMMRAIGQHIKKTILETEGSRPPRPARSSGC